MAARLVNHADVVAARELLRGVVRETPLEPARMLTARLGGPAWFKCENLQRAGSYKVRGAYVRIARLSDGERARGVVAASAGNHAQGVALAAGLLGAKATVFMPAGAPLPKVMATRGYGAQVELVGTRMEDAFAAAQDFAERSGAVLIHPFDHPDVIAGQGTVALEILEQCPDVRTIVAAVGGGGLVSGLAVAVFGMAPAVQVVGVQAAGAAAFPPSLAAGSPVQLPGYSTIADGIAVGRPGDLTFQHVRELGCPVRTVSDEELSRALVVLLERNKLVVEPAGAAGAAAVLAEPGAFEPPVVVVLSGGNVDPLLLVRVIENGLGAAGRFLRISVRCPDRPGSLAAMLTLVAEQGANVLDIHHERLDPDVPLGEAEVELSVETRGAEHSDRLVHALRAADYQLSVNKA